MGYVSKMFTTAYNDLFQSSSCVEPEDLPLSAQSLGPYTFTTTKI